MLILYGTLGCHLCEQAQALIGTSQRDVGELRYVDIASDDQLVESYGVRIPVVKHSVTGEELGWPFDLPVFEQWLMSQVG